MTTIKQVRAYRLESARNMRDLEIELMETLCEAARQRGTPFDTSRIQRLKSLSDSQLLQWAYGDLMM